MWYTINIINSPGLFVLCNSQQSSKHLQNWWLLSIWHWLQAFMVSLVLWFPVALIMRNLILNVVSSFSAICCSIGCIDCLSVELTFWSLMANRIIAVSVRSIYPMSSFWVQGSYLLIWPVVVVFLILWYLRFQSLLKSILCQLWIFLLVRIK